MGSVVVKTFKGDSAPDLTFTITRTDGSIVDLTGAKVYLIIRDPITKVITNNYNAITGINNACNIIAPATNGVCTYTWNAGGTDVPDVGIYEGNIQIVYPDNSLETYDLKIVAENPISGWVVS